MGWVTEHLRSDRARMLVALSLFLLIIAMSGGLLAMFANWRARLDMKYLETVSLPAIAFSRADGAKLSRIGGLPSLADDVKWPEWKGKPLAFLCQINLAEIPAECERNGLPVSGMLYFFYVQDQETWGGDPKDKGSWSVIYAAAPPANDAQHAAPKGLSKESVFAEKPIKFAAVKTYPDFLDARIEALNLNNKQEERYGELRSSAFKDVPVHHLFGHPAPIQSNDMDLESQLGFHGIQSAGEKPDPRAKELAAGRHDWILLLQLDTDDDAKMMWGDAGMLYFWIRKQDLAERRFDNCWMVMQCY